MIDLLPSEEQQQIMDGATALLRDRMPVDRLRAAHQGDNAVESWSDLVEFGWFLFGLPEAAGGLGVGVVEEMLLAREAGRFLLPPSVLATSVAVQIAAGAGDTALVQAIATGEARAGFAAADRKEGAGWLLIDADRATHVVEFGGDEIRLWPLDAFSERRSVASVDETASLERAQLRETARGSPGGEGLTRMALILVSSALVGLAEASLALAADYAKIREQFGQPIGAFQAIKHRCADMAVHAETAGAQVGLAALSEAEGLEDASFQIWSALLAALTAARENGASGIQVHGGMGFTWECHAHRYMKRAQLFTQLLGGSRAVETRLLEQSAPR